MRDPGRQKDRQRWERKEWASLVKKHHRHVKASPWGHRTIKTMAERSGKSPIEAVFWYNVAPRYGQQPASVPQKSVSTYEWRLPVMNVPPAE